MNGISHYFNYLSETFTQFFRDIGSIFTFKYRFLESMGVYTNIFRSQSAQFGVGGWIVFVVVFLLLLTFFTFAVLLFIYLIIRIFSRLRVHGKNEAKMLEEIERLNLELYDTIREKDRITGLIRSQDGLPEGANGPKKDDKEQVKGGPRFPRLVSVDEKYKDGNYVTTLSSDVSNITLKEICERFRNFACSQLKLYYTIDTVRQFFAAMGTGKFIILEGISGTGKTSLPYCMGRFFKHNANICPVQPSWRDRSGLLGYYNDFTKKFTETEFLRSVYEALYRNDCSITVLDEMNLARVEYYFAEFLSIMEMPNPDEWIVDVIASSREDDPKHLHGGQLLIPQNIWFIGTANNDDSTFTITDKVYDRATSLFFDNKGQAFEAPYTEGLPLPAEYLLNLYAQAKKDHQLSQDVLDRFAELDDYVIEHFKLAFGNRIMKQLYSFVPCYIAAGGTELEAFDFMFKTKILKKFEVLNVGFLKEELELLDVKLNELFGQDEFKLSHDKIRTLIKMSQ
jgi:hypothetical protein